jgi:hypothetical protein
MPAYQCCFLDRGGNPVRIASLQSGHDQDAHREAMALLIRSGRFAGFELWCGDLRVEVYKPQTNHSLPDGAAEMAVNPGST